MRVAERGIRRNPRNLELRQALGAALYRAGRWEAAAAALRASVAAPDSSPAYAHYFLAMTRWRQGQSGEARAELRAAIRQSDHELAASPPPAWNRRVTLSLLRREAEAMIQR